MTKLLIIPMLFACCTSMGQAADSARIIGKSILLGNLVVAQNDFPNAMNWNDAKKACAEIGEGWRLPTEDELMILLKNKDKIGGFADKTYWSSSEEGDVYGASAISFPWGSRVRFSKKFLNEIKHNVRAIKAF